MGDYSTYYEGCGEAEAERRKKEVGMAEPGTPEYYANAEYILSAYEQAGHGCPSGETRAKLAWLRKRRRGY